MKIELFPSSINCTIFFFESMEKVHTSMENSTDYLKCGIEYQTKSNSIDTKKEPASQLYTDDRHPQITMLFKVDPNVRRKTSYSLRI